MYISQIEIRNLRSIKHLTWSVDIDNMPGWHVILGDNGSGKSTFVQAVALALIGSIQVVALRLDHVNWIRRGELRGSSRLTIWPHLEFDEKAEQEKSPSFYAVASIVGGEPPGFVGSVATALYDPKNKGWFCASYGPYRRFTGGNVDIETLYQTNPRLARHLTAFGENVALTEITGWLQELQFKRLEDNYESAVLLDEIKQFINQSDFLPFGVRLHNVNSDGVHFVDGNESQIKMDELSDGFRSILSLTLELIRQLVSTYGYDVFQADGDQIFVNRPGVVLVDEIDAHLHPTWQRKVGQWFTKHFPQIQFIVTTHSPLVCQAAVHGSIFKLPTPGTDEQGEMITGTERDRLLYGNILDAYSTEVFGAGITRSPQSQEMLNRLGALNIKELREGLTVAEKEEQERLRAAMPTAGPIRNGR